MGDRNDNDKGGLFSSKSQDADGLQRRKIVGLQEVRQIPTLLSMLGYHEADCCGLDVREI